MLFRRIAPRLQPGALQSGDLIEVAGRPVRLTVNPRARRVSLRLDAGRREVVATAPSLSRLAEAAVFAQSRAAWIADHLDRLPQGQALAPGAMIEVGGAPCRLERAAMRIRPRLVPARPGEPQRLLAYGVDAAAFARAIERALRAQALAALKTRTAVHCARLGVPEPQIAVGDARGRWGSCRQATRGKAAMIRYSWRLILTPPWVLDYVAAHECAHLIEANHGADYWALVATIYGRPTRARAWLRAEGARLHAIGR